MTTGLWAAASGLPVAAIPAAVPPACRRATDAATARTDGDEAVIEAPPWATMGATHFVFNLNADYAHSPADRLDNDLNVLANDVFPYFRSKY